MNHDKSIYIVCDIGLIIYDKETKKALEFQSLNEQLDFLSEKTGMSRNELDNMFATLADQTNRYNIILNTLIKFKKESLN